MTKRILIAAALLCAVTLTCAGLWRMPRTRAGSQHEKHPDGGPVLNLARTPGVEIDERDFTRGKDGRGSLRVRLGNRSGKKIVAWMLASEKGGTRVATVTMVTDEARDLEASIEVGEDETADITVVYEGGRYEGGAKAVGILRTSLEDYERAAPVRRAEEEKARRERGEAKTRGQ